MKTNSTLAFISRLLLAAALLLPVGVRAQDNTPFRVERGQRPQGEKPSPEKMMQERASRMARNLVLDSSTAQKFIPLYIQYTKDLREVMEKFPPLIKGDDAVPTEEEIAGDIENSFRRSEETIRIRREYYGKFSDILSQAQIRKIYSMEKMDGSRLSGPRTPSFGNRTSGRRNRTGRRPSSPSAPEK